MLTSVLKNTVRPDPEAISDLSELSKTNITKKEGKKKLREEFKRGKEVFTDPTEEREAFRARLLACSLFPNVFNKETIMTSLGPS